MVSRKIKIINPSGLHLKTATVLSNSILKYSSTIQFEYEKNNVKGTANLKSLLSILAAGIRCGQEIEITCQGEDEKEALEAIVKAVESGLGETVKICI